ncbi:hypothetical protein DBIPINDM_001708 [Mesorhizobium sp. AR02]|uniref:hypothetical protein n=1 Tax=Mesorhizobium sp. AR02 TaxID=2865837 RepID=UPI00215EE488|nr:hypothetical protein [Mesorhizobium sp. AR02]UVK55212.1 hypothetical protein DBIPINDM_001708 [Mesorhizobium sp. AR02]
MTAEETKKRQMPKGGRKGGSVFPRIALQDALGYARKLVSKTHTSAQPMDIIFSGVVGAKSGKGRVRISALRQYGLLKGDVKSSFIAGDLAKKISAAPEEELIPLYQEAILKPTVFKTLFDTFHGDIVTKSKLKQRAADLKIHPDETETCVELYISGMQLARLVTVDGDRVTHVASNGIGATSDDGRPADDNLGLQDGAAADEAPDANLDTKTDFENANGGQDTNTGREAALPAETAHAIPRAIFNVNVTLDSSLDTEKLKKQLELLKQFGAI